MKKYEEITKRIQDNNHRYWAGDNISEYIKQGEKEILIDEATEALTVLDRLIIDLHNDPNSQDTARRLAKMYYNELMRVGTIHVHVIAFPIM